MANKKKGFMPIYRSIQDHWLWKIDKPFDERSAWIDLLLLVNHAEEKVPLRHRIVTVHAGQKWTSYLKLAQRWHWSKNRVIRYLTLLKSDGMIYIDSTADGTMITLVNYSSFNNYRDADGAADGAADGTTLGYADGTTLGLRTINKDNKKIKTIKEKERFPSLDEIEPPVGGGQWQ